MRAVCGHLRHLGTRLTCSAVYVGGGNLGSELADRRCRSQCTKSQARRCVSFARAPFLPSTGALPVRLRDKVPVCASELFRMLREPAEGAR